MKKKAKRVSDTGRKQSESRQVDDKKKRAEMLKQKWNSLSQAQQAEARKILSEKFKAKSNISPEERGPLYNQVIDSVRSKK